MSVAVAGIHGRRECTEVLPAPGSLRAWLLAARPRTLTAAASPVMVGTALAWRDGCFEWGPALAAFIGAGAIQIGTNLANDWFDFEKGADTAERIGPVRAAQSGLLTVQALRRGTFAAFAVAVLAGMYLLMIGGWPIVAIGVASVLSGLAYTGGPYPLGYHGLGDLFVFIFFGPVAVAGTYYVQAQTVTAKSFFWSIPVGLICAAILVVNNVRDMRTDVVAGKRTLAVRFGLAFGRVQYALTAGLPFALTVCAAVYYLTPSFLLVLAAAPAALQLIREFVRTEPGPRMNDLLAGTARLLFLYSLLLSVALVL